MNAGSGPFQIPSLADPESYAWRLAACVSSSTRRSWRLQDARLTRSQKVRKDPDVKTPVCASLHHCIDHNEACGVGCLSEQTCSVAWMSFFLMP